MFRWCTIAVMLAACNSAIEETVPPIQRIQKGIGLSHSPELIVDLVLPPHNRPPNQATQERWQINGAWTTLRKNDNVVEYAIPKPYRLVSYGVEKGDQPDGMTLALIDGPTLRFAKQRKRKIGAPNTWGLSEKRLVIRLPKGSGPPTTPWLTLPAATLAERSLNFDTANLEPKRFALGTRGLSEVRAHGIYLPAPASMVFEFEVPQSAVFQTQAHLLKPAISAEQHSDGAIITATITGQSGQTELIRTQLSPGNQAPIRVDLTPWSGQNVRLKLNTETLENSVFDYVFLVDPVIYTPSETPQRTLLVLIDTLRQDHIGAYGYARPTTPNIDAFAQTAVVFDQARAPSPWTLPSSLAALYGRTPEHVSGQEHLGELLGRTGWASCAVISNNWLIAPDTLGSGWTRHWAKPQSPAAKQAQQAAQCLAGFADRDTLLFVHMIDPHTPYIEAKRFRHRFEQKGPAGLRKNIGQKRVIRAMKKAKNEKEREAIRQYLIDRYDQNVLAVDEAIGALLTLVGPRASVVLTADHGEEFFEHGGYEHGHTLFEELIRVPLMIRSPELAPHRTRAPVALMDIVPTVLDLLDQPVLSTPTHGHTGLSLVPVSTAVTGAMERLAQRPLAMGRPYRADDQWGVFMAGRKWISTGPDEAVYDLSTDPGEQHNIADATPELGDYPALLSTALDRPVRAVIRVSGTGPKRSIAGGPSILTIRHPAGIESAWIRIDPNGDHVQPVLTESIVRVPIIDGKKTPKEVFVIPTGGESSTGLSVTRENADTTISATVGPKNDGADTQQSLTAGTALTGFTIDQTWQPLPDSTGGIVYIGEKTSDLRALGYVE